MNGEAHTFAEFVEYYKDGAQWYWDQAKPAEATPTRLHLSTLGFCYTFF